MSSDLTTEQLAGSASSKVRSSAKLAQLHRAAASEATPAPAPQPRSASARRQYLRDLIVQCDAGALIGADDRARLVAIVTAVERAQPGASQVLLNPETATEVRRLDDAIRAAQARKVAERTRDNWPTCAPGPCEAGPQGLQLPTEVKTRAEADAILAQLVSTRGLRELTSREKEAFRALRRQGIRQPSAPEEFAAIGKATLRRRSKAAKRARNSQRMMEGNRAALQRLAGEGAC